jgi:hypothetical protein
MNTFKRKALSCAILGGLGAAAGTAQAVYQDPSGQGQVLLYPYYTVQAVGGNSYNTYLSVVNTTTRGKALKVRFREGKNSREVLDFNLFLSPNDVWTGVILPTDTSATSAARLITNDTSCTNPPIPATGIEFRNYAYVGAQTDSAGAGVDRTREGYLEILEMATVNNVAPLNALTAITHTSAGTPANCAVVQSNNLATTAPAGTFTPPNGGLNGTYTLINVQNGADMGGNAYAFSNFRSTAGYTDIGDETYNLSSGDPVSVVVATQPTGTTAYLATFTNPVDAVSATMMHSSVINEYALDTATRSNTDWVMTFPTKRFYVTSTAAATPFTNKFTANGACELISFQFFNREERGATAALGDFSPSLPGVSDALCWESTVLSIRNGTSHMPTTTDSGVLGSKNSQPVSVTSGFQNGWAQLTFTGTNAATVGITSIAGAGFSDASNVNTGLFSNVAQNYRGLPVIGFMVRTLFNGTLTCTSISGGASSACQGSYGSLFDHKYVATITPAP